MPILEDDAPRRIGDLDDRVVVLLVGDDRGPVADEEGVVGEVEAAVWRRSSRRRVSPDDPVAVVEEEQPVGAPVGDQQLFAGERRAGAGIAGSAEALVRDDHLDVCDRPPPPDSPPTIQSRPSLTAAPA